MVSMKLLSLLDVVLGLLPSLWAFITFDSVILHWLSTR